MPDPDPTPPAPQDGDKPKPPWGDPENFDADRAWKLIQNLKGDNDRIRAERDDFKAKATEADRAKMGDLERAQADAQAAREEATKAQAELLRLTVAAEKGLTPAQARRLVGATKEELLADADELLDSFGGTKPAGDDDGTPAGRDTMPRRPQPRLRPGSGEPQEGPEETDPRKLAALIEGGS